MNCFEFVESADAARQRVKTGRRRRPENLTELGPDVGRVIRTRVAALLLGIAAMLALPVAGTETAGMDAVQVTNFVNSLGTLSAISVRGENLAKTIECAQYLGVRWLRAGIEGHVPIPQFIELHQKAGVKFSWGFGSGSSDLNRLIETGRQLAAAGALLAFEGPNEPNNWGITYQGQTGGRNQSWMAVAKLQHDLYQAVKSDPQLKQYPVWSISEGGAETDNAGLQFLTIPPDAHTLMPAGTEFADYANVHNYIYHPNSPGLEENKTWNAADPGPGCKVDGLFGEYGVTWAHHYPGYSTSALVSLPRVTTETGTTIGGVVSEEIHALNLLSLYLDQFKRGWAHTAVYLLRDRVDEAGNQQFGFYRPDYSPRKAAVYLHNLTTLLADQPGRVAPAAFSYAIPDPPSTLHDLLLRKSNGAFELLVWNERLRGSNSIAIHLGRTHAEVNLYDPTVGTSPVQVQSRVTSVTLSLSDHPILLEVLPDPQPGVRR